MKIGRIVNAQGLGGEVKIVSFSDDPERFDTLERVLAGTSEMRVEEVRHKGAAVIVKLAGIDDRTAAEALKETDVFMYEEDLPEPEEGTYYVKDITGFTVRKESGEVLGRLKDVKTDTAQDLYIVDRGESGKSDLLIPGVREFIKKTDTSEREITVSLPEGLEEL